MLTIFVFKFITPRYTLLFSYSEIYKHMLSITNEVDPFFFPLCTFILPSLVTYHIEPTRLSSFPIQKLSKKLLQVVQTIVQVVLTTVHHTIQKLVQYALAITVQNTSKVCINLWCGIVLHNYILYITVREKIICKRTKS